MCLQLLLRPAVCCGAAGPHVVEAAGKHQAARRHLLVLASRTAHPAPAPLVRCRLHCPAAAARIHAAPAGQAARSPSACLTARKVSTCPTPQVSAASRRLPAGHPSRHGGIYVVCGQPPGAPSCRTREQRCQPLPAAAALRAAAAAHQCQPYPPSPPLLCWQAWVDPEFATHFLFQVGWLSHKGLRHVG